MSERFKLPAAVFLLLIRNTEVLLIRRQNTGWHDGDYDLVAGHLDGKESLKATLCRETAEEIGIRIDPNDVIFNHLLHGYFEDGKEYLQILIGGKVIPRFKSQTNAIS